MANEQNNQQSGEQSGQQAAADNASAQDEYTPMMEEFGPNGIPIHPPQGEEPDAVENELILDTFFGEGTHEPKSAGSQGEAPKPADGQSQESPLARSPAAPAANGEEGSAQEPGPSSTQQTAGAGKEGAGATAQTPGQGQQSSSESQPAPTLSAEDRLRLANAQALEETNRQLLARLEAFEKGGTPQTQPGGQPTTQPAGNEQPIQLVVPENVHAAIMDEDPAVSRNGMSLLITAVAQNVMKTTLERVAPLIDQKLTAVTEAMRAGEAVSAQEEAYFGRYPQHKNELYRPLIQSVVTEKYRQFPHAQWDETMMDAVGATVNAKLLALGIDPSAISTGGQQGQQGQEGQGQQNGQPQPKPNGKGRAQPAPMLDASTRGAVPTDTSDFIANTFS